MATTAAVIKSRWISLSEAGRAVAPDKDATANKDSQTQSSLDFTDDNRTEIQGPVGSPHQLSHHFGIILV